LADAPTALSPASRFRKCGSLAYRSQAHQRRLAFPNGVGAVACAAYVIRVATRILDTVRLHAWRCTSQIGQRHLADGVVGSLGMVVPVEDIVVAVSAAISSAGLRQGTVHPLAGAVPCCGDAGSMGAVVQSRTGGDNQVRSSVPLEPIGNPVVAADHGQRTMAR
jgi:hypothetical protein